MANITAHIKRFCADQSGATMIEYGLIAALLSVGVIVAAGSAGVNLSGLFSSTATDLSDAEANIPTS